MRPDASFAPMRSRYAPGCGATTATPTSGCASCCDCALNWPTDLPVLSKRIALTSARRAFGSPDDTTPYTMFFSEAGAADGDDAASRRTKPIAWSGMSRNTFDVRNVSFTDVVAALFAPLSFGMYRSGSTRTLVSLRDVETLI